MFYFIILILNQGLETTTYGTIVWSTARRAFPKNQTYRSDNPDGDMCLVAPYCEIFQH